MAQGAVFMCRKSELLGTAIMALGAGVLVSLLFSSDFVLAIVGLALLLIGLCCTRRCK